MEATRKGHGVPAIRPLRAEDIRPAVDLFEAVAAEGKWIGREAPLPTEAEARRVGTVERFERDLDDDTVCTFVAEEDGLVGLATVRLASYGTADLAMFVAGERRGRGIGTALLDAVVDWARDHGARKLALQVWPHNVGARTLYERAGFVEEGRLRRHYRRRNGELWDAILMGLILDTTSPGSSYAEERPR
jgi:RimJ/RimL family protein N-acetyltransferase